MITFHDGTHADLADYTGRRAWNNNDLLGHPGGRMAGWNANETVIRGLLTSSPKKMDGLAMNSVAVHGTETIWVVKGFHQTANPGNAIAQVCHLTLSFRGRAYHVDCMFTATQAPAITNVTAGDQHQTDLDGFTTVTRKGK